MIRVYKDWYVSADRHGFSVGKKYVPKKGSPYLSDCKYFNTIEQVLVHLKHLAVVEGMDQGTWEDVKDELEVLGKKIDEMVEELKGKPRKA